MKVRYPSGNVLLRKLDFEYPVISHGDGIYLFDKAGKKYVDAVSGMLVVSVGHANKEVIQKISAQLSKVAYVNGNHFTNEPAERLAAMLAEHAKPLGLNRTTFLNSGSEATEAAIKMARQIWVDRGQPKRTKLIARTPGYHGNTLYALSASARPHYKKVYGPLLSPVHFVDAPYAYRTKISDYEKYGAEFYAGQIKDKIDQEGAETVAAIIVETVVGSSAGASVPPAGYFEILHEIRQKTGVLLIADEVMCGSGRTGRFFAAEHFAFKPDILTLGKGIAGGYASLSAVMTKDAYVREMQKGSGGFIHAQTFMMHPASAAAGVAVLEYMEEHDVLHNAGRVGNIFQEELSLQLSKHPHVGNVGGIGMMAGIEFVKDKKTKEPFARDLKTAEKFTQFALGAGIVVWPNVGQADGTLGDLVMVGPPLTTTVAQVKTLVTELAAVIQRFFSSHA